MFDRFFEDVGSFYDAIGMDSMDSSRIYNIDESWFNPADEKGQQVVVDRSCKVPYKIYGGVQEHITLTMCAAANGKWLPPMFTFKTSLPRSDEYHTLGPQDALFNATESGHINTDVFRDYLMHLEPYLNPVRPVVIFQDNLKCHEDYDTVKFCVEKGIHLFNFPKKVSHIIQPLDKLFGPLKQKFEKKRQQASLINQKCISKSKIPIITKHAMNDIKSDVIKGAFVKTGVCPLDRSAITADLLVGDTPKLNSNTKDGIDAVPLLLSSESTMQLGVFDDDRCIVDSPEKILPCKPSPTDGDGNRKSRVTSLVCSNCLQNDVTLHPAVRAGIVDIELASAFMPDTSGEPRAKKPRITRECSTGRWLTHASAVERMREEKEAKEAKERAKVARQQRLAANKLSKQRQKEEKQRQKELELEQREREKAVQEALNVGSIGRGNICKTCVTKANNTNIVSCLLCAKRFHTDCLNETGAVTICKMCQNK